MAAALAPQARAVMVLAPLPHACASPLPQLARFARLSWLTLRHIHAAALPALGGLTGLRQLNATGGCWFGCFGSGSFPCSALRVAVSPDRHPASIPPRPLQYTSPEPKTAGWIGLRA